MKKLHTLALFLCSSAPLNANLEVKLGTLHNQSNKTIVAHDHTRLEAAGSCVKNKLLFRAELENTGLKSTKSFKVSETEQTIKLGLCVAMPECSTDDAYTFITISLAIEDSILENKVIPLKTQAIAKENINITISLDIIFSETPNGFVQTDIALAESLAQQ
jgi:hypothetical protein